MEKTINIQNCANITANGELNSCHCKPVICLETGDVYTSVTDAAKTIGVRGNELSSHLTGKRRSIKGMHFCYLSRATESLDAIVTRLRETSAMEEDARKWRAYQEEQEAIRKAKEKYESDVQKVIDKIKRRTEMCERINKKYNDAVANLLEAEKEYEDLTGKTYGQKENENEGVWSA